MARTLICFCCHKYRQTIICFILFASTFLFTNILFIAEARQIANLNEVSQKESMLVEKAQIGSRPPKCERRCRRCEHSCEAVQVPIVPEIQKHRSHYYYAANVKTYSTRGDDLSNYKPISWKCRCGDYFFNP